MSVYITGDTHGGYDIKTLLDKKFNKDDIVIICGDFGYVFESRERYFKAEKRRLDLFLKALGCQVLFCDGNHSNHLRLNQYPTVNLYGGKAHKIANNCYHLMRGEVFKIKDKNFLALGGATSHDKIYRTIGVDWWAEEEISQKDYDNAIRNVARVWEKCEKIDYVVTHTLPLDVNNALLEDLRVGFNHYIQHPSNVYLQKLYEELIRGQGNTFYWFCGHFHVDDVFGGFHIKYNDVEELF